MISVKCKCQTNSVWWRHEISNHSFEPKYPAVWGLNIEALSPCLIGLIVCTFKNRDISNIHIMSMFPPIQRCPTILSSHFSSKAVAAPIKSATMPQGCFQQVSCQRLDLLGVYCHRSLRLQGTAGWKDGLRWWICSVPFFLDIGELENWQPDGTAVCNSHDMSLQLSKIEQVAKSSFSRRMKCKEPHPSWPFVFSMDWFHASWELFPPWWSSSCALICWAKWRLSLRSRLWKRLVWKLKLAIDLYQEGNRR